MTSLVTPILSSDLAVSCSISNGDEGLHHDSTSTQPADPAADADAVTEDTAHRCNGQNTSVVDPAKIDDDHCHVTEVKLSMASTGGEPGEGDADGPGIDHGQCNGGGEPGDGGPRSDEVDDEGYRVEHRYETECISRSREVRDLCEDCTELRMHESKEVTLQEVKVKEGEIRPATQEEIRALLEAQFDGKEEIEISREVVIEEFTRVESHHAEVSV